MMRRKTADPKVARLRSVSLFSACDDKELSKIVSLTDEMPFDEGQVLTREGRPGSQCFVVVEGEARVSVDGEEVAVVGPGAIVGEMSLLDAGPRSATVTAITPMRVLVLGYREFMGLLGEHPSVLRKILRTLTGRIRTSKATCNQSDAKGPRAASAPPSGRAPREVLTGLVSW